MALSDEQIDAVITAGVKSGAISWLGFKKDDDGRYTLPVISPSDRQQARAIEAEVRKQEDALIRQLLEAAALPSMKTEAMLRQRDEAITAARARLEQPCG